MAMEILLSMLLNLPMIIAMGAFSLAPIALIVYAMVSVANAAETLADREPNG